VVVNGFVMVSRYQHWEFGLGVCHSIRSGNNPLPVGKISSIAPMLEGKLSPHPICVVLIPETPPRKKKRNHGQFNASSGSENTS
jgi:hypothetical protein